MSGTPGPPSTLVTAANEAVIVTEWPYGAEFVMIDVRMPRTNEPRGLRARSRLRGHDFSFAAR